jgi:exopolyphosphatase/guanosine-5'-triphosphate,3'-diphosphate pyrophosphatase
MQAAEQSIDGHFSILAADREVTRIGSSVFSSGRISDEAITHVCTVLSRNATVYKKLDVVAVRAVATSAVRDASNQREFIERASEALNNPVEIISGAEEARLIHLGVQSRWPHPRQTVLVIDVGGGSAEFIVSKNGQMVEGISRPLGAVRLKEVFLKDDPPSIVQLNRLLKFIDEKIEPAIRKVSRFQFDRVIATSATAAAIVSSVNKVPRNERDQADHLRARLPQVRKLLKELSALNLAGRKKIAGIGPRRAELIVPGTAVFLRSLELVKAPAMYYSTAGVRDGIIADLASRGVGKQAGHLTPQLLKVVEAMSRKYNVDLKSARHVANLSAALFEGLQPLHKLSLEHGRLLQAASFLHNTGHFVSDTGHHKHSAYLVSNSDLPGYTDSERNIVSLLCRYHRKSLPTARHEPYRTLAPDQKRAVQMLTPLLRIAVGLEASRDQRIEHIAAKIESGGVTLSVKGEGDIELDLWGAERGADSFRQIYGVPMNVSRMQS